MTDVQPLRRRGSRRWEGRVPSLAPACCLVSSLLALAGAAAADAPGDGRCEVEATKEAFASAMGQYIRRSYAEAIPDLEEAAALCPVPDRPWDLPVAGFGLSPYLPFYYLGKSHQEVKHYPSALRHFYASRCVGEPARDRMSVADDLGTRTEACRRNLAKGPAAPEPGSHPQFKEGIEAAIEEDWVRTADKMLEALLVWDKTGRRRTVAGGGRWTAAYLPRLHLGEALFNLGCYKTGCDELDRAQLDALQPSEVQDVRKTMARLAPQCERKRREQIDKEICTRWQCLLKAQGR